MWSPMTDLFYLAQCFQGSPRLSMDQYFVSSHHKSYSTVWVDPTLFNPFISWWILELLPLFDYDEQCCYEHQGTSVRMDMFPFLLALSLGVKFLGHLVTLCLIFGGTTRPFFTVNSH